MVSNSPSVGNTIPSPTPWAAWQSRGRSPEAFPPEAAQRHTHDLTPGFQISIASTAEHRREADALVGRRYAERGYRTGTGVDAPQLLTLCARAPQGAVLGTISVRLDSERGLNADALFGAELRQLRAGGKVLCEFTQLAVGEETQVSKRVLAALFHTAYLMAHREHGAETLVVEVNPRHVPYYRRMLGFKVCGEPRMNMRVQAPAVLMSLDFTYVELQIARYGGQPALASVARTFYPHVMSPLQERELLKGLRRERA